MTWQLGAFTILLIALAGGFAWYERGRPDARIVALVATLAAFAALGRIAFAAVPNVKPTTDIVLISGYALGAAPGFVVGAVAGLSSNFFFGQGPWTPWQMAAWGGVGLMGAALATLTGRRVRRWPLAIVCGLLGFAFTVVQDIGDWVTYSDHSAGQLGVYIGKGVGFDLVHAFGCVAFALAFGPALARSIGRFATRLQIHWQAAAPAGIAVVLAAGIAGQPARGASTATTYLVAAQNSDGGFGAAPGQPSSQLFSGWAALGLAAAGIDPQRVVEDGRSLTAYIAAGTGAASDPGSLERAILALRAAGLPATNVIARLKRDIGRNGSVSGQTNLTAFAILALRAAGLTPSATTTHWLVRQQDRDGGFNFLGAGGASDIDDTGAVLEALGSGAWSARAVRFIESHQNRDGGFPSQPGETSNAQSTAWGVQGLLAVGATSGSTDRALAYLRSLSAPDGHIRYSRSSDQTPVWVTSEAMMAIARKPLPLTPVAAAKAPPASPAHARSRQGARRRVVTRRGSAHRHSARRFAASRDGASTLTLATDAGVAAALVLAPIGLG
jgi:energy-coupling factor transport system substrate-specific component